MSASSDIWHVSCDDSDYPSGYVSDVERSLATKVG